jgi:hypothetical protein
VLSHSADLVRPCFLLENSQRVAGAVDPCNTAGWVKRNRKNAGAKDRGDSVFFKDNEFEFQMVMVLDTTYYKVRLAR